MQEPCTHYCARPWSLKKAMGKPLDYSALGNPFQMERESQRDEVIAKFRIRLWELMQSDNTIKQLIESIPLNATLGCFCAPKKCHCDVIADAVAWSHKQKQNDNDNHQDIP